MDFLTKSASRKDIRRLAPVFRKLFNTEMSGPFPVLAALDHLSDVFQGSNYVVVESGCLPEKTMARCMENDLGGYTIEIKESVYDKAYNGSGADLSFICHELCHVFLFEVGYSPIVERNFSTGEILPYQSVEWQAKALCGEVLIPFEESLGMDVRQIVQPYHVSWESAEYRVYRVS